MDIAAKKQALAQQHSHVMQQVMAHQQEVDTLRTQAVQIQGALIAYNEIEQELAQEAAAGQTGSPLALVPDPEPEEVRP